MVFIKNKKLIIFCTIVLILFLLLVGSYIRYRVLLAKCSGDSDFNGICFYKYKIDGNEYCTEDEDPFFLLIDVHKVKCKTDKCYSEECNEKYLVYYDGPSFYIRNHKTNQVVYEAKCNTEKWCLKDYDLKRNYLSYYDNDTLYVVNFKTKELIFETKESNNALFWSPPYEGFTFYKNGKIGVYSFKSNKITVPLGKYDDIWVCDEDEEAYPNIDIITVNKGDKYMYIDFNTGKEIFLP